MSGLDTMVQDAVTYKMLKAPLTKEQLSVLFQHPGDEVTQTRAGEGRARRSARLGSAAANAGCRAGFIVLKDTLASFLATRFPQ